MNEKIIFILVVKNVVLAYTGSESIKQSKTLSSSTPKAPLWIVGHL